MWIRKIVKIMFNSIIGSGVLYLVNTIGGNYNFHIGLNWWTVFGSGLLGMPGVVLIIALKLFMLKN